MDTVIDIIEGIPTIILLVCIASFWITLLAMIIMSVKKPKNNEKDYKTISKFYYFPMKMVFITSIVVISIGIQLGSGMFPINAKGFAGLIVLFFLILFYDCVPAIISTILFNSYKKKNGIIE